MNDEFPHQFRKTPRPEFADALYQRISSQPESRFVLLVLNRLIFRNVGAMPALMLFIAACAFMVADKRWNKVGDIWVDVQKSPEQSLGIQWSLWKGPTGDTEVGILRKRDPFWVLRLDFPHGRRRDLYLTIR